MADPILTYTREEKTALLHMDDGKANALSDAMIDALLGALTQAEQEASAIVLAGRPDRFCAGFDLRTMMSSPAAAKALLRRGAELLMRLYGSPLPVVIACTGHALAGGALMLLTGDHRIGAAGAFRIGLNEVQIGIPVPMLGVALAHDRIAAVERTRATLHAHIYPPEEAVGAGFLDVVVTAGEVLDRARAEAARLGGLSRPAFAGTKRRLRGATIAHILGTLEDDLRAIDTAAG